MQVVLLLVQVGDGGQPPQQLVYPLLLVKGVRVVDFLGRLATRDVEGGSLNLARSTLRLNRVRVDIQELEQFSEFAPILTEFINEDHLVTVIAFPPFVSGWSVDRQAMLLPDISGLAKASFAPTPMDFNSTMDSHTRSPIRIQP